MARVWYIRKRPLKFDEISKLYLKLLTRVKKFGDLFIVFLAFSEFMNLTRSPNEPKIIQVLKSCHFFAQITEKTEENKNFH